MTTITEGLKALSEYRSKIEEEAKEKAVALLRPGLKKFMEDHPDLRAIRWTQYTPYFNDGDECVFGVHDIQASLAAEGHEEDGDEEDGFVDCYGGRESQFSVVTWKDLKDLNEVFQKSEPELQAAFGNHVRVTVTRKGVDVEEYEHD